MDKQVEALMKQVKEMSTDIIAVIVELGEFYKKKNSKWQYGELEEFVKEKAPSLIQYWHEAGLIQHLKLNEIIGKWDVHFNQVSIKNQLLQHISSISISKYYEEFDYLMSITLPKSLSFNSALEELETIYKYNARLLANLKMEELKGIHNINSYAQKGWLNDCTRLNIHQHIIEEIFNSVKITS